jgi:hypothetical protein
MKNQEFAMIAMALNDKHKCLYNFDCFFCDPTPFLAYWIVIAPH